LYDLSLFIKYELETNIRTSQIPQQKLLQHVSSSHAKDGLIHQGKFWAFHIPISMHVVLFNTVIIIIWVTGPFVPKSFHTKSPVQIFYKLLLPLDNDQLMSEKPKKWGSPARFGDKAYRKRRVFRSFGYVK